MVLSGYGVVASPCVNPGIVILEYVRAKFR